MCTDTYTRAHDAHLQSKLSQAAAAANDVSSDVVVVDVVYCCSSICLVVFVFVACNLQTSLQKQYTHTHILTGAHTL